MLLEELRTKTNWGVPDDFAILRNTVEKARGVLVCVECPVRYLSVVQNGLILGVLATCIAESYARLLEQIDQEELRATSNGERKQLAISDVNSSLHDSTGPGTRPSFSVEVAPTEWREIMRGIAKAEIHGVDGRRDRSFMKFVFKLEERQKQWHRTPPAHDCPPHYRSACETPDRVPSCLVVIDDTKRLVSSFHL